MNVNHKLELLDQLDDAAFALMMDEYAEAEGERLRAEFEADMRAGLTPPKPEGLDEKCRKQIKAEYGRARWKEYGVRARKLAVKAAAMVLIGVGIAAATVMSVDALRIPFINFIIDRGIYSVINPSPTDFSDLPHADPFLPLLPDEYTTIYFTGNDIGLYNGGYCTADGASIYIDILPGDSEFRFDTENAECYTVTIDNHDVLVVEKEGFQAIWMDESESVIFAVIASDLSETELISIISGIIKIFG